MLSVESTEVKKAMQVYRNRLADVSPALEAFLPWLSRSIQTNFDAGGRPPWAPLSARYLRWKVSKGYPAAILVMTGALRNSVQLIAGGSRISASAGVPYAAAHQFGVPARNLPARPFLVMQSEDEAELQRLIADYLTGAA